MVLHFDERINVDNSDSLYEEMKCAFQSLNYFKYKEYGGNIYEVPISYYDNPQKSISELQYYGKEGANRGVCSSIYYNFRIINPYIPPREPRDFEDIVYLIKKGKKINMSYVNKFTFDYYDNNITIDISGFDIIECNEGHYEIPMECCEIYSPRNNIYFIICECMKNIEAVNKNKNYGYLTSYSAGQDEISIMYKDTYGYCDNGYVNVSTNIDDVNILDAFYCSPYKGYKYINYHGEFHYTNAINKFFDFVNKNNITFELKIFDSNHTLINTINCTINFKDNFSCEIHNENNIDIIYVGEIRNIHHNTFDSITESIKCRINLIEENLIFNDSCFFDYIKAARKEFIKEFQEIRGCGSRDIWKLKIKNITKMMIKYKDIRSKHIKNKVSTFALCLKKKGITIPNEMWMNILYYNDFEI